MTSALAAFRAANDVVDSTLVSCKFPDCVDEADRFGKFLLAQFCVCNAAVPLLEAVMRHKLPLEINDCGMFTAMRSSHAKMPCFTPDVWYNLLVKRMRCPCKYIDNKSVQFAVTGDTGAFDLAQFRCWLQKQGLNVSEDMTVPLFFLVNLSNKNLVDILSGSKFPKHTNIPVSGVHDLVYNLSRMEFVDSDSYTNTWLLILRNMTFDDKPVLKVEPKMPEPEPKPKQAEPTAPPSPSPTLPKSAEVMAPELFPVPSGPAFEEAMQEEDAATEQNEFTPQAVLTGQIVPVNIACTIDGECEAIRRFRAATKLRAFVTTRGAAKRFIVTLFGGRNWRSIYVAMFPTDSDGVVKKIGDYRKHVDDMSPEEWQDTLKTATTDVAPTAMPEAAQRELAEFRSDVTETNLPAKQRGGTISEVVSQMVTVYAPNWTEKWCQRWKLTNELVQAVDQWKTAHPRIPTPVRILLLVLCRSNA